MESANREEAERALDKAKNAFKNGDVNSAYKFALKSLKLCSTKEGKDFLDRIEKNKGKDNDNSHGTSHKKKISSDNSGEKLQSDDDMNNSSKHDYTPEQVEAVQRILACKNYYEILGVGRDVTDSELKRQYKQLALVLHPDKNRAPQSDEAFKAVSKAYATLSDPTQRNHYDRFGEDGLQSFSSGVSPNSPDDYLRFVFTDFFDDEDFFSNRNVFVNNRRSRRHFYAHHRPHRQQGGDSFLHICQILPILLIILVSIFSSLISSILAPPPVFSLRQSSDFSVRRIVPNYDISYYVKPSFDAKDLRSVEQNVMDLYIWELREQCQSDRSWGVGSGSRACKKLRELHNRKQKFR